jgi:hypothetical protein
MGREFCREGIGRNLRQRQAMSCNLLIELNVLASGRTRWCGMRQNHFRSRFLHSSLSALRGIMQTKLTWPALTTIAFLGSAGAAEKPRVFITESASLQLSGEAAGPAVKGSLALTGGTSPQNVEVMKVFVQRCPGVTVTANHDKADYLVRLDHEAINPTTLFVHGNKVAVFDKNEDLIYSSSSRTLSNAVKGACTAISVRSSR